MKRTPRHNDFGKRLAAIRKARGLSQRDLAKLVGMSNRMIAYYKAQVKRPPAEKLVLIAKALKISTDELLGTKPAHIKEQKNSRIWKRLQIVEKLPPKAQRKVIDYAKLLAQANNRD